VLREKAAAGISRSRLAKRFEHLTDEDLTTQGAYVFARRLPD
jgi:hypothetical protein